MLATANLGLMCNYLHPDCSPLAWGALDLETAAYMFSPLAHRLHPQMPRVRVSHHKTLTFIPDLERERSSRLLEAQRYLAGVCVFDHILQSFLRDAEKGFFHR
jgi:hypothetical protein